MNDDDRHGTPWSAPDAEPERRGPEPLSGLELSESAFRWAATAGFIVCGLALLWVLGTQVAPWVACVAGVALCAVPMARLWARHGERISDARIRRENSFGAHAYSPDPPPPSQRSFSIGPGNDDEHDGTADRSDRYGPYGS